MTLTSRYDNHVLPCHFSQSFITVSCSANLTIPVVIKIAIESNKMVCDLINNWFNLGYLYC